MSNVIHFPGSVPAKTTGSPNEWASLEEMRRLTQPPEAAAAKIPTESQLLPFYGNPDPRGVDCPFFVYADLSFSCSARSMRLPNHQSFLFDLPSQVKDPTLVGLCTGRVITEAYWIGCTGNEPWKGLEDPVTFSPP